MKWMSCASGEFSASPRKTADLETSCTHWNISKKVSKDKVMQPTMHTFMDNSYAHYLNFPVYNEL